MIPAVFLRCPFFSVQGAEQINAGSFGVKRAKGLVQPSLHIYVQDLLDITGSANGIQNMTVWGLAFKTFSHQVLNCTLPYPPPSPHPVLHLCQPCLLYIVKIWAH